MSAKYKKREGEKKYINEMKWIRKVLTFFFFCLSPKPLFSQKIRMTSICDKNMISNNFKCKVRHKISHFEKAYI